eukprot:TRINITY_DN4975_c0_g1_i1.p1 TRINITY_DN4975_c0_g1~~TRINITY_DN4975_c0_g1_i1.p1  ORF type:complete len:199 (-),score=52.36 TRINITY_DN4975_c0_g1_i1:60-656(-)
MFKKKRPKIYEYKFAVMGSPAVGKSALTVQLINGVFVEKYDPTIEDNYRKFIEVDKKLCMLEILDTTGRSMGTTERSIFLKEAGGIILVYSITSKSSLNDLNEIRDEVVSAKNTDDFDCIVVGNKLDLKDERTVSFDEGKEFALKWNFSFIESSSKTGINIQETFVILIRMAMKRERILFEKYEMENPVLKEKSCILF